MAFLSSEMTDRTKPGRSYLFAVWTKAARCQPVRRPKRLASLESIAVCGRFSRGDLAHSSADKSNW